MALQGNTPVLASYIGTDGWMPFDQTAYAIGACWIDLYHMSLTFRVANLPRFEWRTDSPGFDEIRTNPILAPAAPTTRAHVSLSMPASNTSVHA